MEIDHITSGDIQTVILAIVAIAVSTWATLITAALLFRRKSEAAKRCFEGGPGLSVFLGLVVGGLATLGGFALLQVPNPLVKLAGWMALSLVIAISAVGGGGLALLAG